MSYRERLLAALLRPVGIPARHPVRGTQVERCPDFAPADVPGRGGYYAPRSRISRFQGFHEIQLQPFRVLDISDVDRTIRQLGKAELTLEPGNKRHPEPVDVAWSDVDHPMHMYAAIDLDYAGVRRRAVRLVLSPLGRAT